MNAKYTFSLTSEHSSRRFPSKIIIAQNETETTVHVALKLIGYLLFFRDRLQIETRVPHDNIPYVPDLAELDYELRPILWVECGECSMAKLQKLAVKAPEANIWIIKRSESAALELLRAMAKAEFRHGRYHVIGLPQEIFNEIVSLITTRNKVFWLNGQFDPPEMKFDLNGLWFEFPFSLHHY